MLLSKENKMADEEDIEFDKYLGQLRLAIGVVLKPLRLYGQDPYVDTAIPEIVSLAVQFHQKMSGLDIPFEISDLHW